MTQGYPDPPMTSKVMDEKSGMMQIIWNKWFQGLRVVVNRLSGGLNTNGSFAIAPVPPLTIPGSIQIKDGVIVSFTPPT